METDLALLVLRSSDIEAARRFYESLGLRFREEQHENGPKHYSCRLGVTLFELYPAKDGSARRVRLGLRVTDPERLAEVAIAAGGGRRPDGRPSTDIVIRDPDGNDIELLPVGAHGTAESGARPSYTTLHEIVRTYSSGPSDSPPFDVGGVIHLMLAALENLRAHWIEADFEEIARGATRDQREHLIKIGEFLRDHPEAAEDDYD